MDGSSGSLEAACWVGVPASDEGLCKPLWVHLPLSLLSKPSVVDALERDTPDSTKKQKIAAEEGCVIFIKKKHFFIFALIHAL